MSTQNVAQIPRHTLASISPVTGERLYEFEQHSDEVIKFITMTAILAVQAQ